MAGDSLLGAWLSTLRRPPVPLRTRSMPGSLPLFDDVAIGAVMMGVVPARFSLESIPDDPSLIGLPLPRASSLVESLRDHRPEVMLYRRLARLRDDVPLTESLADLEWRGARADLHQVCRELGKRELPGRVRRWREV